MNLFTQIVKHCRNRTLLNRIKRKLIRKNTSETPVGDVYYGECADKYLDARMQQEYWHLEQDAVKMLLDKMPNGLKVLDVPFGTGRFVPFYVEKAMAIHGLDASEDMIRVAKQHLKQDFNSCKISIGDARKLPYADAIFDLVVCFRFLSHIVSYRDAREILRELHRVCRNELIVQLRVRRDDVPPITEPTANEHMGDRLTRSQISDLLQHTGWRVVNTVNLEQREVYRRDVFVCKKIGTQCA